MPKDGAGRRAFDGLVLGAILLMAGHGIWTGLSRASVDGDLRAAAVEADRLYEAFDRYYERHGSFPNSHAEPAFDAAALQPFVRRGYYDGAILPRLVGGQADAYGSPDDRGMNQEFWLELSLRRDPAVRLVVARSDDAPTGGGEWLDGVYVFKNGRLEATR